MLRRGEFNAFPSHLTDDVRVVLGAVGSDGPPDAQTGSPVIVCGEMLCIPYRTYYPRANVTNAIALGGNAGLIAACLGSRHHDGYVRQACVTELQHMPAPWVVPYVIELLGEYIVEISNGIAQALSRQRNALVADFVRMNHLHLRRLLQRAISYWNAYYRYVFPTWREFPACAALLMLLEQSGSAVMRGQPGAAPLD